MIFGGGAMVTLKGIFQIAGNICTHNLDLASQLGGQGRTSRENFPKGGSSGMTIWQRTDSLMFKSSILGTLEVLWVCFPQVGLLFGFILGLIIQKKI